MLPSQSSSWTVTLFVFLFIFLTVQRSCRAQYEGDPCALSDSQGICTILENCPSVYEDLLRGIPPSVICGYNDYDSVVCCPLKRSTTRTIATTTTTTRTTTTTTTTTVPPSTREPFVNTGTGAKARQKCQEYASSVYTIQTPPTLSGNRVPVNVSQCAIKSRKLIVGGTKAEPKEFPHMTAVGYDTSEGVAWLCGGTLISDKFVLTAAHCTFNRNWGTANWVRLGDLNLERTDDDARPQNIRVAERIRHPKYRRPSEYHDIALLRLETDVKFNAWVRPSCLPYSLPDTGTDDKATATGWGSVEWAEAGSNDLLKVTISLISPLECNRTFIQGGKDDRLRLGIVGEWQVCAGDFGKDTCQGDSGGPLAILNQDFYCMYSVIGVTSLGKLCGSITPGIYTRVFNYLSWIENIVWPDP